MFGHAATPLERWTLTIAQLSLVRLAIEAQNGRQSVESWAYVSHRQAPSSEGSAPMNSEVAPSISAPVSASIRSQCQVRTLSSSWATSASARSQHPAGSGCR